MNNRQTSNPAQAIMLKGFALLCVLLITACDGGIFGTGGPDDVINVGDDGSLSSAPPDTNEPNTSGSAGSVGSGNVDGGSDGVNSGTEDSTAGGTTGGADGSGTDGGATDEDMNSGSDTSGQTNTPTGITTTGDDGGRFVNNTTTLDGVDTQINLVNATSLTLNVFETSVDPATLLFDATGVMPSVLSASAALTNNLTSLAIVDNSNVAKTLLSYPEFDAEASTLTTILVRESTETMSAVALVTETQTTDQTLSRLRVVQAGTLGDASVEAMIQVQSAGPNPGGVNNTFGPISYALPQTDYIELPAGDYELIDDKSRLTAQFLNLSGGTVHTVVLMGDGTNSILLIDDSASAQ